MAIKPTELCKCSLITEHYYLAQTLTNCGADDDGQFVTFFSYNKVIYVYLYKGYEKDQPY